MDELYMKTAIECANNGHGRASTKPLIGIVIVKDNKILAKCNFASIIEINLIQDLIIRENINDKEISKSTIYINYPYFSEESIKYISKKNIFRIVFGTLKPDIVNMSSQVAKFCKVGLQVKVGVLEDECNQLNEIYNKYFNSKMPFVHTKWCMTLDGKAASNIGNNTEITSNNCNIYAHELRNKYSAIMIGINTLLKDNPTLKCKYPSSTNPVRIVVDSTLRIEMDCTIIEEAHDTPIYIAVTKKHDKVKAKILQTQGVKLIICNDKDGKVDLVDLMTKIYSLNIDSVLIEGGGNLIFSALESNVVDKVSVFIGSKILGGKNSLTPVTGNGFDFMRSAVELEEISYNQYGTDLLIEGYTKKS